MSSVNREEKKKSLNQLQQNDWNMSSIKRPKLDVLKNHLSQSASVNDGDKSSQADCGKAKSLRRRKSMPSKPDPSPLEDDDSNFLDMVQEEFYAIEAKVLAEAADKAEFEISKEKKEVKIVPSTSPAPVYPVKLKHPPQIPPPNCVNNGSSGFEALFADELAEKDVEEWMILASQEIQASQNLKDADNTAYNIFSKGANVHSSILEPTFKVPYPRTSSIDQSQKPHTDTFTGKPSGLILPSASSSSSRGSTQFQNLNQPVNNPQAEAEVRRLSLDLEKIHAENKKLKESLRTKDGEAAILRTQVKKALADSANQKTASEQSYVATEKQYKQKLLSKEKEIENLRISYKFMVAEYNAAKQRLSLLTQASQPIKLVQPSTSTHAVPPSPPQRGLSKPKHVSNFLNRSTFEDTVESSQGRSRKRPRHSDECEEAIQMPLETNRTAKEIDTHLTKPESKTSETQTNLYSQDLDDFTWMYSLNSSVGERLVQKLSGLQLASVARLEQELTTHQNDDLDDMETIPTLSLLTLKPNPKKRRCVLDDQQRPRLLSCSKNLQSLMAYNDPTTLCAAGKTSLLQVYQECCGIIHYNLFLLQDMEDLLSAKQLSKRDQEIIMRCSDVLPLHSYYDLLDDRPWHKDEFGIEVRRSLGILSELAAVYRFGALLVTGQSDVKIPMHRFTELSGFIQDCAQQTRSDEELNDKEQLWFLKILSNLTSIIVRQKCTIALSGVLAGIVILLKTCAQQKAIVEESQMIVLAIIRDVLLTRPPSTVLLFLLDLLVYCAYSEVIIKGLCSNCDDDDCIQETSTGTCNFSKSTCILQLLCIQLKTVTEPHCWRLVDVLLRWLSLVMSLGLGAPSWILSSPDCSHISCCNLLMSTVVSLLWDTFKIHQMLEEGDSVSGHEVLPQENLIEKNFLQTLFPRIMRRAIGVFHGLLKNNMCDYMGQVEGSYECLLRKLSQMNNLNLTPALERELNQLLKVEQAVTKHNIELTNKNDQDYSTSYWNCSLSLLNLSP